MFYYVMRRFMWRCDYIVETYQSPRVPPSPAIGHDLVTILASTHQRYQHTYPANQPFKLPLNRDNLTVCKVEGYYTPITVMDFPLYISSMQWISNRFEGIMKGEICI